MFVLSIKGLTGRINATPARMATISARRNYPSFGYACVATAGGLMPKMRRALLQKRPPAKIESDRRQEADSPAIHCLKDNRI
jgi:hypothetical protein